MPIASNKRSLSHLRSNDRLLRQRCISEIRLDNAKVGEESLSLGVFYTWVDNDIVTRRPIDRCGDTMLVRGLVRVNYSEKFRRVTTSGGRVGEDEANDLLGINDENRANGEGNPSRINIGGILMVKPGNISSNT